MRRSLSAGCLIGVLVVTVWFALWEAGWREKHTPARLATPASLEVSSAETPLLTALPQGSPASGGSKLLAAFTLTETPLPATRTPEPMDVLSITPDMTRAPQPVASPTATRLPARTPTPADDSSDVLVPGLKTPTPPPPDNVNGVPVDKFVVMPDAVKENVRAIYARGLALGRNPRAFSKMGDSTIENPFFLARFDGGSYKLGDYAYLRSVINYFAGSFGRHSMTVRVGLHSWSMLNSMWADKTACQPNESPAACEFRLHKPVLVLIRLGANDAGTPQLFKQNMERIITYTIASGVIPVLGTKADRFQDPENRFNDIIRQLAADYQLPLWDFDLVAQTMPGSGLSEDNVHMTAFLEHDYTQPEAFKRGHSVHNLTALILLDKLWRELVPPNN